MACVVIAIGASAADAASPGASAASTGGETAASKTLRIGIYLQAYEAAQKDERGRYDMSFDPARTYEPVPWEIFRCCLARTLMTYPGRSTADGGGSIRPDLALAPPDLSPDGLTWTFHLRPGPHYAPPYADTPIVSGDVIRALERAIRPNPIPEDSDSFALYANLYTSAIAGAEDFASGRVRTISGLEAPDAQTLVVHVLQPTSHLPELFALPVSAPIPAGAADGHDTDYGRFLVSSGPYMLEGASRTKPAAGYVPGKSVTLVRNPSWRRELDPIRPAAVDEIRLTNLEAGPDQRQFGRELARETDLDLVTDGRLDLIFDAGVDRRTGRIGNDPALATRIFVEDLPQMFWITMNLARAPFDDIHVRRAVSFAVDRRAVAEALGPQTRVSDHALPDALEDGLLQGYAPFRSSDGRGDLVKARAEMARSGYDTNHDGRCDHRACGDVWSPHRADFDRQAGMVAAFAESVAPLGLAVTERPVSGGDWFANVSDPRAHVPVTVIGWQTDFLNASDWLVPLASGRLVGPGEANLSLIGATSDQLRDWGYGVGTVPSLDPTIDDCAARMGFRQTECWAMADQYLTERVVAWVPIGLPQTARLVSERVDAFSMDAWLALPALDQISLK